MPKLDEAALAGLFGWIVDAQEFIPLTDPAKQALDELVAYQQELNQKQVPEPRRVFMRLTLPDKFDCRD